MRIKLSTLAHLAPWMLCACVSSKEGQTMRADLMTLQDRLLKMESSFDSRQRALRQDSDSANLRVAGTATRLDALEMQTNRIKGEIDTIKVGVHAGKIPGSEETNTVFDQLSDLKQRLELIEASQADILSQLEKLAALPKPKSKAAPKAKASSKSGAQIQTLPQLEQAFRDQEYGLVASAASSISKKLKSKPETLKADYLKAEALFRQKKYKEAALAYSEYADKGPPETALAQAKLKIAESFQKSGDKKSAKLFYEEVQAKFAKTPEGLLAANKLKLL